VKTEREKASLLFLVREERFLHYKITQIAFIFSLPERQQGMALFYPHLPREGIKHGGCSPSFLCCRGKRKLTPFLVWSPSSFFLTDEGRPGEDTFFQPPEQNEDPPLFPPLFSDMRTDFKIGELSRREISGTSPSFPSSPSCQGI